MKRLLICIASILFIPICDFAQSYGLVFSSHEVVQEKRTSLDLSPDDSLCFSKDFELSFDINFLPLHEIYFGYIFRIIAVGKDGNDQNIDLIYNQRTSSFRIIIGENFSGISFSVDSPRLYREWNLFSLHCDLDRHVLRFAVNGRSVGSNSIPVMGGCFKFLWGADDFRKFRTRDIPPMQIKDIRLSGNGTPKYHWSLDETSGDIGVDKAAHHPARIKNPIWLKPKYQQWDLIGSFAINGYAGVAYNARQDKLFLVGSDSLAAYTFTRDGYAMEWAPCRHLDLPLGHQNIYDTLTDKLYDVYIDRKTVISFNFGTRQWEQNYPYAPLTEYWHANKFISIADTSLYIVGGYGQLHYKNLVQRYHFASRHWDTIRTGGAYLPPRYLAGLGVDPQGRFAYIAGGYGSQTGDQMLDPRNYYDLFQYDIRKRTFRNIYSLKPLAYPFTLGNSLVIPATPDTWYGLQFANDSYNSKLQLIQGSLTDSAFRLVGNSIPYSFHDIQSFADLYYSPVSNKLIAVTLFYSRDADKEKNTQVRVYTLDYPPEPADIAPAASPVAPVPRSPWLLIVLWAAILGITASVILRLRRMRGIKRVTAPASSYEAIPAISDLTPASVHASGPRTSAIYLFGPFQVFDKEGHDCTRLFTPLLRELFLIITTYTFRNGRGISSEGLNEILWHDKAEKDAKNNRSVNLAKLKPILEKIGNCVITKESGYWLLQIHDDTYIDYKKSMTLLEETAVPGTQYIHSLVDVIKRGPFLLQTEYNWLDDIKSEISNAVIDHCLGYLRRHDIMENPEFTIEITNCIFFFDQLNEDALTFKCKSLILLKRHNLASNTYLKFVKDYKDIYSADFDKSFQEIIA
ncbi:MAG TPA: hypothetical protein VNV35_13115 [Puia sp.]|nr:hypothetical protein [Puia sp.]